MGSVTSTKQQLIKYEQLEKQEKPQTQSILIQTEQSMFKVEQNNEQVLQKQTDFVKEQHGIENQKQIPIQQVQQINKQQFLEPGDQKKLMEIISNYKPQITEIPFLLKPFIPNYIPAFVDVEDCLFIPRPDKQEDHLGFKDLRETKAHRFVKSNDISDAELQFIHDQEKIVKIPQLQKLTQQSVQVQKQQKQCLYQEKWYMDGEELQDQIKRLEKQYIAKYQPKDIVLNPVLKPFIPDYIPAIRGPCEMILVPRPDGKPDYIGIKTLPECDFDNKEINCLQQLNEIQQVEKT